MKRFFPIAIFLVLIVFSSAAQNKLSFKTEELKRVAVELELDSLHSKLAILSCRRISINWL